MVPGLAARRAFWVGRRGSFCGGCASACLILVLIVAVLVFLFWREVNSAIRGVFPSWPLVLAVPILFFAYSPSASENLVALFRAHVELPVGGQRFRLYLFCHGIPDRCLTIRGHPFLICARCTGLLIGIAVGFLVPAAQYLGSVASIGVAFLLGAPLLVDGLTQLVGPRQSTNPLRVVTGVLAGLGLAFATQVLRLVLLGF